MAKSNIVITAGSGTPIDTQIPTGGTDHRQVYVQGSPTTLANVAEVDSAGRGLVAISGMALPLTGPTQIQSTTANSALSMNVANAGNVSFALAGTSTSTTAAVTTGAMVFEQSVDNINWSPLLVVRSDTGAVVSTLAATTIAAGAALILEAGLEGVNWVRVRPTANNSAGTTFATISAGGSPFMPSVTVTQGVVTLGAGSAAVGSVTANPPTVTKGTQGSTGYTTQDLKDAGRLLFSFSGVGIATVTTEALLSGTTQKGATQGTAVTNPSVTSGKRMRIQAIDISLRATSAAVVWGRFALRTGFNTSAVTASSPIAGGVIELATAAVIGATDRVHMDFPDGLELDAGVLFGLTQIAGATTGLVSFSITGYEY